MNDGREVEKIEISPSETNAEDDRFHRFSLIQWWDQKKLAEAKILVIGAGALGNEIVKNLALLGVGRLLIADMDRIENSNLSRSILYRETDSGIYKAETAARRAKEIYPQIEARFFNKNVVYDMGLGFFRWADLVVAGLDNREARLAINRNCWKLGKTWIDGAIEGVDGVARVFAPGGPCYECTMSETDWKLLNRRKSCNLLSRSEMESGKTPTTPTISSIIAGVQCQEVVKILHGMESLAGKGFTYYGQTNDAFVVEYQRNDECYGHDVVDEIVSLNLKTSDTTIREALTLARENLGEKAVLELSRDILKRMTCPQCGASEDFYMSLGQAGVALAPCPSCGADRRVETMFTIRGDEDFLDRTFEQIGIPPFDIVWARNSERLIGYEFSGDSWFTDGNRAGIPE